MLKGLGPFGLAPEPKPLAAIHISRLRVMIDEKEQPTQFTWNRDDTLEAVVYFKTPGVSFTYDPDYRRVVSMTVSDVIYGATSGGIVETLRFQRKRNTSSKILLVGTRTSLALATCTHCS